ncbi:helix-turn-helix domain-containing protein [Frankia sp. Cr1]|uniref:helix-turn-helix domain-containing protein n=1 Tax=Frankia sp. Cr1 TaxID=3073931 RepID=UPI002AD5260C|nr:helix-turn-helix domain-containing protein [Frankia sp. Cr1]
MEPLSIAEVLALPATVSLMTAARALGCGRNLAYELASAGTFPCPVHRVGRVYRVRTADILRALNINEPTDQAPGRGVGRGPEATRRTDSSTTACSSSAPVHLPVPQVRLHRGCEQRASPRTTAGSPRTSPGRRHDRDAPPEPATGTPAPYWGIRAARRQ